MDGFETYLFLQIGYFVTHHGLRTKFTLVGCNYDSTAHYLLSSLSSEGSPV